MNSGKLACIALIAPLGLVPVVAEAGFYSGDELYAICTRERGSKDYVEKTYECIAYITGAVDAFNTTRKVNKLESCIPADVTINQLKTETIDYLQKNPKDRQGPASEQVFAATRKAWPCAAPKASPKNASATKAATRKRKR
ncbi:MAG: hypothetical protein J7530_21235 [Novosphingobium sp.]|nr:hypothetical protein [Novosphingobium sp.]